MRSLFLIRHAKAVENNFAIKDFERDLQPKGIQQAESIALELKNTITLDNNTLFISSPANRARQTAQIFASILDYPSENIQFTKELYDAHFIDILSVINNVDDQFGQVLLFGHNPGISNLVNYLSHSEISLSTSNLAQLSLAEDSTFKMLSGGTTQLIGILK